MSRAWRGIPTGSEGGSVVDIGRLAERAVSAADVMMISTEDDAIADLPLWWHNFRKKKEWQSK